MPRKKEKESCECMGPEMGKMWFKHKTMMGGPWGMWGCYHKGHGIGAFVFAGSVIWMLSIIGTIPPAVPWWLEFLAALGFAGMFS
jgi:hypothetical protein